MAHSRTAALLLALSLATIGLRPTPAGAGSGVGPSTEQERAIQRLQKLLDEQLLDPGAFQKDMPLTAFLHALEKQLPAGRKVALRLDRDAFGKDLARVAETLVRLPAATLRTSLRAALQSAVGKLKTPADYRIGGGEVVLTTPPRALYTVVYEIRGLLKRPEALKALARGRFGDTGRPGDAEPAQRAALVIQAIFAAVDPDSWKATTAYHGTIEVVDGQRLAIRANATRHAQVAELLGAYGRIGDLAVFLKARLYEVDRAVYTKLRDGKRVDLEELERQFLAGVDPKGGALWQALDKQQPIRTAKKVRIDDGLTAALLSRHRAVYCLPRPGEKAPQAVLEGVAFRAGVRVSADRRFVRVRLVEKLVDIQEIKKVKVPVPENEEVDAEVPILNETEHSQVVDIPDGGAALVAVHVRPRALRAGERWWVLRVDARIIIEEEERQILFGALTDSLDALVADVLKNPRLKRAREFAGTPGDDRFALVDSDGWAWPKGFEPVVAGRRLAAATRTGKRLLGIRVDHFRWAGKGDGDVAIAVTLVNAGGSENGEAVGNCTLRYTARAREGGWVVELAEAAGR